jgi:hypothetical protein
LQIASVGALILIHQLLVLFSGKRRFSELRPARSILDTYMLESIEQRLVASGGVGGAENRKNATQTFMFLLFVLFTVIVCLFFRFAEMACGGSYIVIY